MKNGEISGLSGILSGMIKAAGEAGVDMITDLINQIIVEGIFPEELELSTVNCFKRKRKLQRTEINRSYCEDTWESY